MAWLPMCGELRSSSNSIHWEPMFILYCQRDQFLEELDSLGVRHVPSKMAEFLREIQIGDKETMVKKQMKDKETVAKLLCSTVPDLSLPLLVDSSVTSVVVASNVIPAILKSCFVSKKIGVTALGVITKTADVSDVIVASHVKRTPYTRRYSVINRHDC
ncbi:hypothetical protein Tco_0749919 [Tanacetum coccineum]|uniref:Uncharacterized protein n=1 Tax=Tanacetum coccineum TaxID=301880 RepID=A0ABQ4Z3F4_9ASTR